MVCGELIHSLWCVKSSFTHLVCKELIHSFGVWRAQFGVCRSQHGCARAFFSFFSPPLKRIHPVSFPLSPILRPTSPTWIPASGLCVSSRTWSQKTLKTLYEVNTVGEMRHLMCEKTEKRRHLVCEKGAPPVARRRVRRTPCRR